MKKIIVLGIVLTLALAAISVITTSTAHTEDNPQVVTLWAGQNIDAGTVSVWNDGDNIHVEYETTGDWVITETHLYVGKTDPNGLTSAPGQFPYSMPHDPPVDYYPYVIDLDIIDGYHLKLNNKGNPTGKWEADGAPGVGPDDQVYIAAHAVVMDTTCYQTAVLYGIERYTGTVYGIDVLSGTSWVEFDIAPPPPTGSAKPNGLAYDAINGRFYYCDYQPTTTLYFWDTAQHTAGSLIGNIADADFYNGNYYYISGPPASDDLYEVQFNADGTIAAGYPMKIDDIADNLHGWTFNGDIAIKDGVIYGWGYCNLHGYEFFTYDLGTGAFNVNTVSYTSSLQLGFGSDGTLYGHRSGGAGQFYVVDTTNGDVTMVTPTPSPVHLYTDCSSGEICVPTTETAWGEGTEFSNNWAMYFEYIIQETEPVLIDTISVPSDGSTVTSIVSLDSGEEYILKASGTYTYWPAQLPGAGIADAKYSLRPQGSHNPGPGPQWISGDDLGSPWTNYLEILVNGAAVAWGVFNPTHIYEISYTGDGNPVSFKILDSHYGDNSGSLQVEIYELP